MRDDAFHQSVIISIDFGKPYKPGEVNRILKELGAVLHYDVYAFERTDKAPNWQSSCYIYVTLLCKGKEVDAQEISDKIELYYPLATIGTEFISKFAEVATQVALAFNSTLILNDSPISKDELISYCDELVTDIMENWGEEPGSKMLRILIEENYR